MQKRLIVYIVLLVSLIVAAGVLRAEANPPVPPGLAPIPPLPPLPAIGQPPAAQVPTPAPAPAPVAPPAAPPAVTSPVAPPQIEARVATPAGTNFFFDDADIFEVAQTVFGQILKVNYIIDPQVKGRVNFRTTTPIPNDKILSVMEIIFRLNGIAIVEEAGIYRIIPMGGIAKEPAMIRFGKDPASVELKGTAIFQVVPIEFMNSADVSKIITPLLTQGGAVFDIPKKNFLIIADTDANVKRLLQLINMVDENAAKDVTQPKIYVYPLQNSKADHISQILQQVFLSGAGAAKRTEAPVTGPIRSQQPSVGQPAPPVPIPAGTLGEPLVAPGTKIFPDDVTNSLVIYASPGDYALIQATIKQLDTTPRQVMIEAVVASVTLTDNLTLGLQWTLSNKLKVKHIEPFSHGIHLGGPLGFQGLAPLTAGSFGYTAIDAAGNVRLLIEALVSDNKAKIMSAPHILVSDNREARIQVGDQIPIATSTTSTPVTAGTTTNPVATTSTIQYKDTGTILRVKPQINDSGLIALELSQEVSTANTQSVLGTSQFVISKREVSTNLVAQNGQTIVIGGLIDENGSFARTGIPLLSKIPILGYLFGRTTNDTTRTELVVLLTPHVVRNEAEAEVLTSDYMEIFKNVTKELKLKKQQEKQQEKKDEKNSTDKE